MKNNNFVKYKDLLTIKDYDQKTNNEEFVFLPLEDEFVIGKYTEKINMLEFGEKIPVRKTVYLKLLKVAKKLKEINSNYKLVIVYGFRDMSKQVKYFNELYISAKEKFDNELDLLEYIHEKIAVPEVSGHPTGGAVDIIIYNSDTKKYLNFGSDVLDYSTTQCYYYNENISDEAILNRKMLRNLMIEQEFAPYDGEWWHFSYGDKEWAFFYKKEKALYNQMKIKDVFKSC